MNTKASSERYQRQVQEISKQPGNETCADCRGRYPRWASWNLGIFLCVNCAGVHRKMGTHISKVKSLTLDTWTKEMVEKMREGGNVLNNLKYNPDERRNRPPANVDEGERNSELERFIFDKYKGKFMDKGPPVPQKDPPSLRYPDSSMDENASRRLFANGSQSRSAAADSITRSRTAPIPTTWAKAKRAASPPPAYQDTRPPAATPTVPVQASAASTSLAPPAAIPPRSTSDSATQSTSATSQAPIASSSVFDDLLQLSNGSTSTQIQPPLQMQTISYQNNNLGNPWAALGTNQQALISPSVMANTAATSYFQQPPQQYVQQQQQPRPSPQFFSTGAQERSASLGNMAFPSTSPFAQSAQMNDNPFYNSINNTHNGAQMMGQQAFGHYNQQQSSPYVASQQTGQPSSFFQQQQTQQQSPQFGNFASSMMPAVQPTTASPWPSSHNGNNQNMWH